MDSRSQVFQRLKPPCVALSQAVLALNGPHANVQTLSERLGDLEYELSSITAKPNSLDEKLADYVFFPISQVLKVSQKISIRCLELTFQCLAVLIDQGWRSLVQPQLAAQIIILCTLMAGKKPQGLASAESTDELQASALWCLHYLFAVLEHAPSTKDTLTSEANFPQLGHTISNILEGISDGVSIECQIAGSRALQTLMKNVATRNIQAAFLPGIVSKLTRVLTPQSNRRNHVVLVGALDVLQLLFKNTLADDVAIEVGSSQPIIRDENQTTPTVIDRNWLDTAATQLKPAITSIMRLRDHPRIDVKDALAQLCLVILRRCRKSLASCAPLAVETILLLSADKSGESIKFRLESLVSGESGVSSLLQDTLHDWLQSLPIKMQGADDHIKIQRIQQISNAYGIVVNNNDDTGTIDRMLASVLRDSVAVILQMHGSEKQPVATVSPIQSLDLALLDNSPPTTEFQSPLIKYRTQEDIMSAIQQLTKSVSISSSSKAFVTDLARSLRQSPGDIQIATFWLLLDATESGLRQADGLDAFLVVEARSPETYVECLEDLYSFALEVLTNPSEDSIDARLQELALRTLALRARTVGKEFRAELIDALYPVLHALATPNDQAQQDAITTLNIFTVSCHYGSVKDLIVENADYLTNAVALRLNAFDVRPQAPQVLLMMVRLTGPSLLPYLEDTIESIFAALEDYHGYPLLVELLFKVLSVVAEEGAKTPQLAITEGTREKISHALDDRWHAISISELAESLKELTVEEVATNRIADLVEPHPHRPWKSNNDAGEVDDDLHEEDQQVEEAAASPPAPKTYKLLLKISELTQHFLPSASASLRSSLLTLLKTTIPAIARHENSFLPLINTIWPEIVSRIDDAEPYVVGNALDIIALMCEYAGDFMRSRILQLWPGIVDIYQKTVKDITQADRSVHVESFRSQNLVAFTPSSAALSRALDRMFSASASYGDTSTRLVWSSLVHAITAITEHTALPPELFDEALAMLQPVLNDTDVRRAVEKENRDAFWLMRMRSGDTAIPNDPIVSSGVDWKFAAVPD